jgi:hypothetical protein
LNASLREGRRGRVLWCTERINSRVELADEDESIIAPRFEVVFLESDGNGHMRKIDMEAAPYTPPKLMKVNRALKEASQDALEGPWKAPEGAFGKPYKPT